MDLIGPRDVGSLGPRDVGKGPRNVGKSPRDVGKMTKKRSESSDSNALSKSILMNISYSFSKSRRSASRSFSDVATV